MIEHSFLKKLYKLYKKLLLQRFLVKLDDDASVKSRIRYRWHYILKLNAVCASLGAYIQTCPTITVCWDDNARARLKSSLSRETIIYL